MKRAICIDVDGTLVDTISECFDRIVETWPEIFGSNYPLSFEQFKALRNKVTVIEDFYSVSEAIIKNGNLPKDIDKIKEDFRKSEKGKKAHKIFYESRERAMKKNLKAWLERQSLYEGVPKMLEELKDRDLSMYVVTSKNSEAVEQLLGNYDLLKYIKKIFDKKLGNRSTQFKRVEKETGIKPIEMAAYDDLAENLIIARDIGIYPIAAPQGYDRPEKLIVFEKAYPNEVPLVIDKLNFQS